MKKHTQHQISGFSYTVIFYYKDKVFDVSIISSVDLEKNLLAAETSAHEAVKARLSKLTDKDRSLFPKDITLQNDQGVDIWRIDSFTQEEDLHSA